MSTEPDEKHTLNHFLSSFQEAGRLDSTGVFTMSGRKAVGKLASRLLAQPADWVLQVVQAACRADAPELRVSQTSKATHLEFQLPYVMDFQALERSLTMGTVSAQPGIDELSSALRVVGLGQDRSWVARFRTGQATHWVLVKGGEASLETVPEESGCPGVTEVLVGVAFPAGESGKVGGLVRFGAAIQNEHEALAQRARACPIPLWLDGERTDTLQRANTLTGGFEHEAFLGVALGHEPSQPPISAPRGLVQSQPSRVRDRFIDPRPFYLPSFDNQSSGSSVLRVAFHYSREQHARNGRTHLFRPLPIPSRVLLVRHGVVVGKRNLGITEPIAVDVYLNGNHERSDLTGLEVEVTPGHITAARAELKELEPFFATLLNELEAHRARPNTREVALYGGLGGLALLLAPWPLKLAALGATAAKLHLTTVQHQRVLGDCLVELAAFRQRHCGHSQPWQLLDQQEQSAAGI